MRWWSVLYSVDSQHPLDGFVGWIQWQWHCSAQGRSMNLDHMTDYPYCALCTIGRQLGWKSFSFLIQTISHTPLSPMPIGGDTCRRFALGTPVDVASRRIYRRHRGARSVALSFPAERVCAKQPHFRHTPDSESGQRVTRHKADVNELT